MRSNSRDCAAHASCASTCVCCQLESRQTRVCIQSLPSQLSASRNVYCHDSARVHALHVCSQPPHGGCSMRMGRNPNADCTWRKHATQPARRRSASVSVSVSGVLRRGHAPKRCRHMQASVRRPLCCSGEQRHRERQRSPCRRRCYTMPGSTPAGSRAAPMTTARATHAEADKATRDGETAGLRAACMLWCCSRMSPSARSGPRRAGPR